jgi:hypothetical protein
VPGFSGGLARISDRATPRESQEKSSGKNQRKLSILDLQNNLTGANKTSSSESASPRALREKRKTENKNVPARFFSYAPVKYSAELPIPYMIPSRQIPERDERAKQLGCAPRGCQTPLRKRTGEAGNGNELRASGNLPPLARERTPDMSINKKMTGMVILNILILSSLFLIGRHEMASQKALMNKVVQEEFIPLIDKEILPLLEGDVAALVNQDFPQVANLNNSWILLLEATATFTRP